jgi:hypothetical protein
MSQRLALQVLHHQVIDAILLADVAERADVRMIKAGNRASLALEPFPCLWLVGYVFGQMFGQILMATKRSSRVSLAR